MLKVIPISTLRAMPVEEQDQLIRETARIARNANDAVNAHKSTFPMAGKLVCLAEERLNELKSDRNPDGSPKKRQMPASTSLAEYWGNITKSTNGSGAKLNPHALSCSVCFGTYVRCDLITEEAYDKNPSQNLELAASISTAVGHDVSHEAVLEAAEELKDRSKDSAKNLRALLEKVKAPKPLTADRAKMLVAQVLAAGFLTTIVIPAIGAEIAHLVDTETGRSAFLGLDTAMRMFEANTDENGQRRFTDEILNAWAMGIQEQEAIQQNGGNAPVEIVPSAAPDDEPPAVAAVA